MILTFGIPSVAMVVTRTMSLSNSIIDVMNGKLNELSTRFCKNLGLTSACSWNRRTLVIESRANKRFLGCSR